MLVTIEISPAIIGRFDRLMNFLENQRDAATQKILDDAAQSLYGSTQALKTAIEKEI